MTVRPAGALRGHGTPRVAAAAGALPHSLDLTVSEALILGLLEQGVRTYFVVLGHGSTEIGERLREYADLGLVRVVPCRNEVEASHAATALRWVTGQGAAVVTSIGPGALQAAAASLAASSDGVGVWHIYGDETTWDEGPNMQQIPGHQQGGFLKLLSNLGPTYAVTAPEAIVPALRRGATVTNHPYRPQPYFLLLPLNIQPEILNGFNVDRLPQAQATHLGPAAPHDGYAAAAQALLDSDRLVIKVGRGAQGAGELLVELADLTDGVFVMSPSSLGIVPSDNHRNMAVGGSKGSISGNYAMQHASTLLVVGSRGVCQSDCSRIGYPSVKNVVNINADPEDTARYGNTIELLGDVRETLDLLVKAIRQQGALPDSASPWLKDCSAKRAEWITFRDRVVAQGTLEDPTWGGKVLTQPAAIAVVLRWVQEIGAKVFFDAGDVQANGFQVADVNSEGWYYSESGASYMGFAGSALLAGGVADHPFYGVAVTGDGSFVMNPQVIIDAVHTQTRGTLVILDNRRMGAIAALQRDQYGVEFATSDGVAVDYVRWAQSVEGVLGLWGGRSEVELRAALDQAGDFDGLSVVHVPVYAGPDPLGGLGAYGSWNVGSWVAEVQAQISRTVI